MKYILSYGGGVNSSALYFYLYHNQKPIDCVIFADTGEETKETYKTVSRMKLICSKHKIMFKTVKSHLGNLYDYYYNKRAVMSMMKRDCTGKFKVAPIRRWLREYYGKKERFTMYIGIAYDEAHRMKDSNVNYIKNSYPFVYDKVTRTGNRVILSAQKFKASKSGCKGCMYQKRCDWLKMLLSDKAEFKRHLRLEENNSRYPEILLNGNYSLRSLMDKHKGQKTLDIEPNCDVAGSCFL